MILYGQSVGFLIKDKAEVRKYAMPTEKKQTQEQSQSQKDVVLVRILERLSNQIHQFDLRMEEMEKNQLELPDKMEKAGARQNADQPSAEAEIEKLHEAFLRYRNDMLKLVNDQDLLDKGLKELSKRQDMIIGAQEIISRDTARLDERFSTQEKAVSEYSQFSVHQGEALAKDIDGVNRNSAKLYLDTEKRLDTITKDIDGVNKNAAKLYLDTEKRLDTITRDIDGVNKNAGKLYMDTEKRLDTITRDVESVARNATKLHEDTEKHLKDEQREIRRQVEELRKETMRRLLALDKIEETLEVILIRTEPPEKKPFFLIRVFHAISQFFGVIVPGAFKNIWWRMRGVKK